MNYEPIYKNIRTISERGAVYSAIETILEALYKKGADINTVIETEIPNTLVRPLKQALQRLPDTSLKTIQTYMEGLSKQLAILRTLSLEIAFDPTEETVTVLIAWVREFLGNDIIMEFSVDRGLFGGARVAYEGRYKEINLATLIEKTMQNQQETIDTMLENISV